MKLLITGGHVTPALAIIDELQKNKKDAQILFVGRRYSSEKSKEETLEYKEVKQRKVTFVHLKAGRFTRAFSFESFLNFLKIPSGFFHAFRILRKHRPDRILTFGGYIALPIALMGAFLHIPVFTHEQTIHPGLANKIIARFARKVFLSFEESKQYFRRRKITVTGNPIRSQVLTVNKKLFDSKKTVPVMYITGGSLGSHSINILLESILPQLLDQYMLIHQTGNIKQYKDYDRLKKIKEKLPDELQKRYILKEHIESEYLGHVYNICDMVIGRAGANTFFELLALQKPALFIPLPWAAHNEQQKQAELFKKWGIGEVFNQAGVSKNLLQHIDLFVNNLEFYKNNFTHVNLTYAKDAAKNIIKNVIG